MNTDHMSGSDSFELGIGEQTGQPSIKTIVDAIEFRVLCPGSPVRRLRLTGNRYTFGNSPGCSIELNDPSLRPMHAVLIRDSHRILVRAYSVPLDVNGNRTTETTLHIGDVMKMGIYQFELLSTPDRSSRSPLSAVPLNVSDPPAANDESYQSQFRQEADRWRQNRTAVETPKTSSVDQRSELLRQREARLLEQESAILEIQEEYANKQREVEELKQREQLREQELDEQRDKIRQLQEEKQRELNEQQSKIHQLQEEKQRELDEQRSKIDQLQEEKQRELSELTSKDKALNEELQTKQSLLSEMEVAKQREIDALRDRERSYREEIEAQQASLARLEESRQQEVEQLRVESQLRQEQLEKELIELREQREQIAGDAEAFQKKYESLEEEYKRHVDDAKQQADTASEAVQKMRDQVAEIRQQLGEAQQLCRETEVARDKAVRANNINKSREDELSAALDSQREQTQQSEAFARKLQVQIDELQQRVAEADSETSQLRTDYDDACTSIRQLELLVDQTTNKGQMDRQSWHHESEELRQAVDRLTVDLAKANSELSDLRTSNQDLSRQLKEARDTAGDIDESADSEAVESLRAELASVTAKLEEMQSSHEETVSQLISEREADKREAEARLAEALAAQQTAESDESVSEDSEEASSGIQTGGQDPGTSEILDTLAGAAGLAASLLPGATDDDNGEDVVAESSGRDSTPVRGQDIVARVDTDLINELQGELASAGQEAQAAAEETATEKDVVEDESNWRVEGEQSAQANSHMPDWYTDDDVSDESQEKAEWQTESPEVAIDNTIDQIENSVDEVISELDAVRADFSPESEADLESESTEAQSQADETEMSAADSKVQTESVSLYEQLLAEADAEIEDAVDDVSDAKSDWSEVEHAKTDDSNWESGVIQEDESSVADDYSPWNKDVFDAEADSDVEAESHDAAEAEVESETHADESEAYLEDSDPTAEYQQSYEQEERVEPEYDESLKTEDSAWETTEEEAVAEAADEPSSLYDHGSADSYPENAWASDESEEHEESSVENQSSEWQSETEDEEEYEHTQHFDPSQFQQEESFEDEPTLNVDLGADEEEGAGSLAEMLIRDLNADADNDADNVANGLTDSDDSSYASSDYEEADDETSGESPWNLESSGYEYEQEQEDEQQEDSYHAADDGSYADESYESDYDSEPQYEDSATEDSSIDSAPASYGIAAEPEAEPTADGGEDDDSIEAYMNRLLQRVHTDDDNDKAEDVAPAAKAPESEVEPAFDQEEDAEPAPAEDGPLIPRSEAPERNSDISAMRELANQTARSAVARSVRLQARNTQVKAMIKFACGLICIGLAFGANQFVEQMLIKVGIILPLLIFAGLFFYDGWNLLGEARKRMKVAEGTSSTEAASKE